uniref:Mediator complex subunit 14 n=1 Tax=Heterorhabditis bacteriophora TaxID=37862 RepID=A0A1I7W8I8_HETBA
MSPRIKDVIIKNGIVSIVVPGEFEVQLTVLGETENLKWTLLNIKILVEDYEIGYGTQLVHPLQLNMLHNVLQSRMDVSKNGSAQVRFPTILIMLRNFSLKSSKYFLTFKGSAAPCLSLPLLRDKSTAGSRTELRELEKALYDGQSVESLRKLLDRLKLALTTVVFNKILLMIERYRRSVATLQVRIINEAQMAPFFKKVHSLPPDRICMQFIKEEHFYLVVTFEADENLTVQMGLYLLCTLDEKTQMMELNREKQLIAAPIEHVIKIESSTYGNTSVDDEWVPACKPSMERQLTSAVAAVDDRISFMRVCEELDKKGIRYNSIEAEPEVGGLTLHITDSFVFSVSKVVDLQCAEFFRNMVRCCLRLDNRSRVLWPFECCMINIPLVESYTIYLVLELFSLVILGHSIYYPFLQVRISVSTVCPPPLNSDPSTPHTPISVCNINFYFHLDPISMNIKLTLDYGGPYSRFMFYWYMVFITRCIYEYIIFMYPNLYITNFLCLEKFFFICFRPSRTSIDRTNEKHLLRLIYNMQTNKVLKMKTQQLCFLPVLKKLFDQGNARYGQQYVNLLTGNCLSSIYKKVYTKELIVLHTSHNLKRSF